MVTGYKLYLGIFENINIEKINVEIKTNID